MGEACLNSGIDTGGFLTTLNSSLIESQLSDWYVLKVRTGGETAAVEALRYRGLNPYCPMRRERRRYSDRMKVVEAAVFPGYVFCRFDIQHKLPIISSPGVEYIVGFSEGPAPIPEEEFLNIRRMIDAGGSAVRSLPLGQRVRVTHGPLQGVEGILVRDSEGGQLVVAIKLLNQGASLHIDEDKICPIATA
jgi:transcription antitermination factor NusG